MHTKAFPYIGLLGFFWGTNLVAARFGVGEFQPFMFIALRLSLAAVCFAPFMVTGGRTFPTDWGTWGRSIVSGILGVAIPMSAFILSLQFMSSGLVSIFVTAAPALIALAAHFFLPEEKLNGVKWLGVGLALLGSIFLTLLGESGLADVSRVNPLGPLMILIGLLSDSANTVFVRLRMREMDSYHVTGIRLITGAVLVTAAMLIFTTPELAGITGKGYFSLLYATFIGAVGGQFMAFYITRRFGAVSFSLVSFVVPIVATFFGVVLLGEIVTWGMGIGVLFIAGGIYYINR
ncbi:MAG: O-acetylserine/cysteine efflux transporter [Cellvibrionaceae bacterium]|jgi:O-acetylserine/cysteine efflux transporter